MALRLFRHYSTKQDGFLRFGKTVLIDKHSVVCMYQEKLFGTHYIKIELLNKDGPHLSLTEGTKSYDDALQFMDPNVSYNKPPSKLLTCKNTDSNTQNNGLKYNPYKYNKHNNK